MVRPELRKRIYQFNRQWAADAEKAGDLMTLLNALPPGQVKNLLKDSTCRPILEKYGIVES